MGDTETLIGLYQQGLLSADQLSKALHAPMTSPSVQVGSVTTGDNSPVTINASQDVAAAAEAARTGGSHVDSEDDEVVHVAINAARKSATPQVSSVDRLIATEREAELKKKERMAGKKQATLFKFST